MVLGNLQKIYEGATKREHLHLQILFAKSYEDIQQIQVQGEETKVSEYVCAAQVINNFGIIIMK